MDYVKQNRFCPSTQITRSPYFMTACIQRTQTYVYARKIRNLRLGELFEIIQYLLQNTNIQIFVCFSSQINSINGIKNVYTYEPFEVRSYMSFNKTWQVYYCYLVLCLTLLGNFLPRVLQFYPGSLRTSPCGEPPFLCVIQKFCCHRCVPIYKPLELIKKQTMYVQ